MAGEAQLDNLGVGGFVRRFTMINGDLVLPVIKGREERVPVALDGELLFNTVPWTDESDGALDRKESTAALSPAQKT